MPKSNALPVHPAGRRVLVWPLIFVTGLLAGILLENRVLCQIAPDRSIIGGAESSFVGPDRGDSSEAARASNTVSADIPRLVADEREFRFGDRERGEEVQHVFVIRNVGSAPLTIDQVKSDCGCVGWQLADHVVEPGKATRLQVSLSLKLQEGPKRYSLVVTSNDPENPEYAMVVSGTATSRVRLEPRDVDFGAIPSDQPSSKTVEMTTTGKLAFQARGTRTSGREVEARVETIDDGKRFRLTITLQPPFAGPLLQGWAHILTDHPDEYAVIGIPVTARLSQVQPASSP
jgi:hypothetical protein